jgi:hypothetical protein
MVLSTIAIILFLLRICHPFPAEGHTKNLPFDLTVSGSWRFVMNFAKDSVRSGLTARWANYPAKP